MEREGAAHPRDTTARVPKASAAGETQAAAVPRYNMGVPLVPLRELGWPAAGRAQAGTRLLCRGKQSALMHCCIWLFLLV